MWIVYCLDGTDDDDGEGDGDDGDQNADDCQSRRGKETHENIYEYMWYDSPSL